MKKFLSVILALMMVFSLSSAGMSAFAADITDIPVIYIEGKGNETIYNADGSVAKNPKFIDREGTVKDAIAPVLKKLAEAMVSGDYSEYIDSLVDTVAPIYEEYVLDENGSTETRGTYIKWNAATVGINSKKSGYGIKDYIFKYDWRLSPLEVAEQLDIYVERVCKATGHNKVNIHARCLGTNFAMAYVQKSYNGEYNHDFRVQNIVLNTPTLAGLLPVGALLSGSVEFDADTIDRFVTLYLNGGSLFEDPLMEMVAVTMVSVMNQATILGFGADVVQQIYEEIEPELLPRLALCCYGAFPSYWSMVSDKYYDGAVAAIFNTEELRTQYAGFIAKTDAYHAALSDVNAETGLAGYEQLLLDLKAEGVNTAVIAKYGQVTVPLFENSDITGDTRGTVTELSLGATGTVVGEVFSESYLEAAEANGTSKYIAADKTVDASTCLFPDTTWFTKNIAHDAFTEEHHTLAMDFFHSNGTLTVDTCEAFPRFTDFESGKLEPVEGEDKNTGIWSNNPLAVVFNFVKMVISLITAFFKGELQLPSIGE